MVDARPKPRIAIVSLKNSYVYGGVLSSLKVAHAFCQKHFDPTVFFLSFDPLISTSLKKLKFSSSVRSIDYFGMKSVEVGARWAFWEPGHYSFNLRVWEELFKDYSYFMAVSGTCVVAHPLALLNKKFGLLASTPYNEDRARRVKELSSLRFLIDRLANKKMKEIEQSILSKANFIWSLSNYSKSEFEKILQKPSQNIVCCGHPVEADIVPSLEEKDANMIIAVGRFSDPRKNINMLLRIFDRINREIPHSRLYVIGDSPNIQQMKPFLSLRSFKNVVFTGRVSHETLKGFYERASLMLLTSYQEGFGVVGIEALFNGIPVIATECGGPSDYIMDGFTGHLVKINDDLGMSKYAINLLKNKKKIKNMAKNAQNFVLENYSISRIEKSFEIGFLKMYPELREIFYNK